MGGIQDLVSHGSVLEGDETKAPIRIWDVDVSKFSKLSKVFLQLFPSDFRTKRETTDKQLARKIGGALCVVWECVVWGCAVCEDEKWGKYM